VIPSRLLAQVRVQQLPITRLEVVAESRENEVWKLTVLVSCCPWVIGTESKDGLKSTYRLPGPLSEEVRRAFPS
jgi:hypothetical protein